ncbi:MAG: hypothetical protein WDN48_03435 [Pseudolabrys sp.]
MPPIEHAPLPEATAAELAAEDVESFAVRRQRLKMRRQQKRKSSRWTAVILVLFRLQRRARRLAQRGRALSAADRVAVCPPSACRSICAI